MKTTLNLFIILFLLTSCQKDITETVSENKSDYEGIHSTPVYIINGMLYDQNDMSDYLDPLIAKLILKK